MREEAVVEKGLGVGGGRGGGTMGVLYSLRVLASVCICQCVFVTASVCVSE